jgi:hypothetical protein
LPIKRQKGRYFSVRFSYALLQRIESARVELYGERTTLTEAVRRLIEERLNGPKVSALHHHFQVPMDAPRLPSGDPSTCTSNNLALACLGQLDISICPLVEEIAHVAMAVDRLIQHGIELGQDRAQQQSVLPNNATLRNTGR